MPRFGRRRRRRRIDGLPATIQLSRGLLAIHCSDMQDLLGQLVLLAQAADRNYEDLRKQIEVAIQRLREVSAINRLIVAGRWASRKALFFSSRNFTREVKVPPSSSDLGKGQRRERDPHGHDTVYLTFRRAVQPRIRLGRGGYGSHSAPLPDLRAGFHRRSWTPPQTGS
jgi:hypothetical protein